MRGETVRAQLQTAFPNTPLAQLRVVVPHRGARQALVQALKPLGMGVLPQVVTRDQPEPLAADLGLPMPSIANPWPLRAQALRLLQEAHPQLNASALIPRTEELLQSLNLLAEHDITPAQLRASVPEALQELWGNHGQVLLQLWQVAAAHAPQFLPAARQRDLWRAITAKLATQPTVPTLWWAPPPRTPYAYAFHAALNPQPLPITEAISPCQVLVAPNRWAEVQRLTLWVAQQLQQGASRVALVATGAMAQRLTTELELRLGIRATTTGGTRWGATAPGLQLLERAARWLDTGRMLSMDYWLQPLADDELPPALRQLLDDLAALPGRWSGDLAHAWLRQALNVLAPHAEDALLPDPRVQILPPHAATQQPWDAVAVADLVEGVWPVRAQPGGLSQAQRRTLGLPTAEAQAEHAHDLLHQLQHGGAAQVVFSRSECDDSDAPLIPSRWWPIAAPAVEEKFSPAAWVKPLQAAALGVFQPAHAPAKISPSLLEALLGCPYQAYASRVLKLQALPPLTPTPDLRERGTLLHDWLAAAVRLYPQVTHAQVAEVRDYLIDSALARTAEIGALERALWLPKMKKLAPVIAEAWAREGGSREPEVLLQVEYEGLNIQARADALQSATGGTVVIDYKTGTPPSAAAIRAGSKPQLALEGWLLQQQGVPLAGLAYWHLKGYGQMPLPKPQQWPTKRQPLEPLLAPVAPTLSVVQQTYFQPQAAWPAVPDAEGAGVLATGACERCELAGVCRRSAWAQAAHGGAA